MKYSLCMSAFFEVIMLENELPNKHFMITTFIHSCYQQFIKQLNSKDSYVRWCVTYTGDWCRGLWITYFWTLNREKSKFANPRQNFKNTPLYDCLVLFLEIVFTVELPKKGFCFRALICLNLILILLEKQDMSNSR